MDEFIVWDKNNQEFIENFAFDEFMPINDWFEETCYQFCRYIGKKDINENKIYANCSIVEFSPVNNVILKGYFYFDLDDLSYSIQVISDDTGCIDKDRQYQLVYSKDFSFKIIDTIQENKLKLIK